MPGGVDLSCSILSRALYCHFKACQTSGVSAGGRRTVTVPAAQGFGEKGGQIAATLHAPGKQGVIPENATLTYDLELIRVSIPPS